MRVRHARPEDAAGVLEVQRDAAVERRWIATQPEEMATVDEEAKLLAAHRPETGALLVAEEDGRIVGILGLRRGARRSFAHVADLGITVLSTHRGKGVGRALMVAAEAWAREVGVRKLTLGVFAHNERAIRLYRGLGYVEEGVRRRQYLLPSGPVDELLMAKWVEE